MRPNDKGWFKDYLELRKNALMELSNPEIRKTAHPEYTLYRVIQPTGLMYGQSVASMGISDIDHWEEKEKLKILLTESLISSSLLFYDNPLKTEEDLSNAIQKTIENIGNFYNNIFPELATSTKTIFGRKKSPVELAETVLNKRIEHASNFEGNFWIYFFHNSLLFLDVFIFGQWIHTNADRIVADFFRYERDELRFSVVKVMAAASHANKEVAQEERRLYEYFVESTDLSVHRRKEALKIFEEGFAIEDINLPSENSWILKRFFLEVAILTIWADKKVEQVELDFLKQFCHYLGFSDDDLENSMISIEGFMLEHWGELEYVQDKQDYQQVSEQFIKRVARLAEKNKTRLVKKIQENEEAAQLMKKASSNELTLEEKEKVRLQLLQVLKSIPTFGILALPHQFLTLPILLKILPKNLFAEGVRG
jgi:tellurite resistance protein